MPAARPKSCRETCSHQLLARAVVLDPRDPRAVQVDGDPVRGLETPVGADAHAQDGALAQRAAQAEVVPAREVAQRVGDQRSR